MQRAGVTGAPRKESAMSFDGEKHGAYHDLRDGRFVEDPEHGASVMMRGASSGHAGTGRAHVSWREIDRQLRRIARRRAALDAEEAHWLLAAHRGEVHARLGFASFVEYVERVLGHGPRVALDRLRVAEALEQLPAIQAALAAGEIVYSAVRELTRVAIADTEDAWLDAAAGRTVRDVETMVRGHRPGDLPDDPTDPELEPRIVRFELAPETYALLRDAEDRLARERGRMLTDDELVAALCQAVLTPTWARNDGQDVNDGADMDASGAREDAPATSGPRYQVAVTVCSSCKRGWQDGGGQAIEIGEAAIETALCDAQLIGDPSDPSSAHRRPTTSIPRGARRSVLRRDHHRCIVPGCRNARWIDVHHLVPRAQGGSHRATNMAVLCDLHHKSIHAGQMVITGQVGALAFHHGDGRPWGAAPAPTRPSPARPSPARPSRIRPSPTAMRAEKEPRDSREEERAVLVRGALRKMGWSAGEAATAAAHARAHVSKDAPLEAWIIAALRACRDVAA